MTSPINNAVNKEEFLRPRHNELPRSLWTEILPDLWQGGTLDQFGSDEWFDEATAIGNQLNKTKFDCVYTFYASARSADWFVKEVRFGFYDSKLTDFDPEENLLDIVKMAHKDWKSGKRVLIRCQAGLNRSGIVMALVLIRDGYAPADAIKLMREKRSPWVLCNKSFEDYLLNLSEEQLATWRN